MLAVAMLIVSCGGNQAIRRLHRGLPTGSVGRSRADGGVMVEYNVRAPETGGTSELVKICNEHAKAGWRLVSTTAASTGITARVYLFFEREAAER
jgi:Domain of unknown function (DUF4177)